MRFDPATQVARWLAAKFAKGLHRLPRGTEQRIRRSRPFRMAQRLGNRFTGSFAGPDPASLAPLCVLPWVHTHIETTGDVRLCCLAFGGVGPIGNVHEQSVVQIFQSPAMNDLRGQMLAGSWPAACATCRDRETMGIRSYRQFSNENHRAHFRKLAQLRGSFVPKIVSIDVRLNNVCNFKCRSCSGFASNRWFGEHNLIYPENTISAKYQGFDGLQSFWDDFDHHILGDLETVHMAGGEPLIMDAHYRLLEKLIAAGKTHVELQYDTNLSFLKFKHWDVVELWRQFPNLKISMSLDGTGEQGEYIREGLNYRKWTENALRIRRELPHATRNLHFVVSIFNVIDLAAHYRAIVQGGFVDPSRITFTFLEWPQFLSTQVLRPDIKAQVENDLNRLLQTDRDLPDGVRDQIRALVGFMCDKDLYPQFGAEFASKTKLLDHSRGQNTAKLFPVLESMLTD